MKGFVYFGRMSTGDIKIGFSTDVARRISSLWYLVPGGVSLLATMRASLVAETWLHRKFSADRISGEWFRPTPDLMAFIDEVKRVGNQVLPEEMRADEVVVAARLPNDEEVKLQAKHFIAKTAEPISPSDKITDILARTAKRTGLSERRVRGMWHTEARAITATEYLTLREVYEARLILSGQDAGGRELAELGVRHERS